MLRRFRVRGRRGTRVLARPLARRGRCRTAGGGAEPPSRSPARTRMRASPEGLKTHETMRACRLQVAVLVPPSGAEALEERGLLSDDRGRARTGLPRGARRPTRRSPLHHERRGTREGHHAAERGRGPPPLLLALVPGGEGGHRRAPPGEGTTPSRCRYCRPGARPRLLASTRADDDRVTSFEGFGAEPSRCQLGHPRCGARPRRAACRARRRTAYRRPTPPSPQRLQAPPRQARGRPRRPLSLPSRCQPRRDPRGGARPHSRSRREAARAREEPAEEGAYAS